MQFGVNSMNIALLLISNLVLFSLFYIACMHFHVLLILVWRAQWRLWRMNNLFIYYLYYYYYDYV